VSRTDNQRVLDILDAADLIAAACADYIYREAAWVLRNKLVS
jgi:hypothetical protein